MKVKIIIIVLTICFGQLAIGQTMQPNGLINIAADSLGYGITLKVVWQMTQKINELNSKLKSDEFFYLNREEQIAILESYLEILKLTKGWVDHDIKLAIENTNLKTKNAELKETLIEAKNLLQEFLKDRKENPKWLKLPKNLRAKPYQAHALFLFCYHITK